MTRTNSDNPDLSVGVMCFKAGASIDFAGINFPSACVKIDRNNLALMLGFYSWAHLQFVDFITTSSEFFFAITGSPD
jgi:hypothetical protein